MTNRERFRKIMNFEPVDALPLMEIEGYEEGALARWHAEGLPAGQMPDRALDMAMPAHLPINFFPLPEYPVEIVREDADYIYQRNEFGITTKKPKDTEGHYSYEGYVDFPVTDMASWMEYEKRLAIGAPGRFGDDWGPETWTKFNNHDRAVGLVIHPFFFRLGLYALGLEEFLVGFYEQPELIHRMFEHRAQMTLEILERVLPHVQVDYACIAEDFGYKHSTHMSPEMYREFWMPHQPPVIEALKKGGVDTIVLWSSGDLNPILPTAIDMGFNCTWPVEEFVGMDVVKLRKEYGKAMRFAGNIGIRALEDGKDAIDREFDEKILPMVAQGGYIPTLDDQASPDISWDNYTYYINRLRELKLS